MVCVRLEFYDTNSLIYQDLHRYDISHHISMLASGSDGQLWTPYMFLNALDMEGVNVAEKAKAKKKNTEHFEQF